VKLQLVGFSLWHGLRRCRLGCLNRSTRQRRLVNSGCFVRFRIRGVGLVRHCRRRALEERMRLLNKFLPNIRLVRDCSALLAQSLRLLCTTRLWSICNGGLIWVQMYQVNGL
jgi:hypothetical protein